MRIWRFDPEQKSLTVVREGTGSGGALRSIVPVKEGKWLVTASQDDRTIAVWDAHSVMGNSVAAFDQHPIALPKRRSEPRALSWAKVIGEEARRRPGSRTDQLPCRRGHATRSFAA